MLTTRQETLIHPSGTIGGMRTPTSRPEQLPLLATSERPARFRLDRHTRELGLAQIAAIRRQLAARQSAAATADAEPAAASVPPAAPAPRRKAA
jgi:hypothetical protein